LVWKDLSGASQSSQRCRSVFVGTSPPGWGRTGFVIPQCPTSPKKDVNTPSPPHARNFYRPRAFSFPKKKTFYAGRFFLPFLRVHGSRDAPQLSSQSYFPMPGCEVGPFVASPVGWSPLLFFQFEQFSFFWWSVPPLWEPNCLIMTVRLSGRAVLLGDYPRCPVGVGTDFFLLFLVALFDPQAFSYFPP